MDCKQPAHSDDPTDGDPPIYTVLDPSNQQAQYYPETGAPPQSENHSGNTAVVSQPAIIIQMVQPHQDVRAPTLERAVWTIVSSWCAILLCCIPLGLAAFIVALVPCCVRSNKTKMLLYRISLGLSIAGIFLGSIVGITIGYAQQTIGRFLTSEYSE